MITTTSATVVSLLSQVSNYFLVLHSQSCNQYSLLLNNNIIGYYQIADATDGASTSVLRLNTDNHGLYLAFDGDISTTWMSKTGVEDVNINITFPHKVKVGSSIDSSSQFFLRK